jgi:MFS superfamily sulfate permease-like transporter
VRVTLVAMIVCMTLLMTVYMTVCMAVCVAVCMAVVAVRVAVVVGMAVEGSEATYASVNELLADEGEQGPHHGEQSSPCVRRREPAFVFQCIVKAGQGVGDGVNV